jgi:hypothetical protein
MMKKGLCAISAGEVSYQYHILLFDPEWVDQLLSRPAIRFRARGEDSLVTACAMNTTIGLWGNLPADDAAAWMDAFLDV